ncbi:hypothetical protein CU102_12745 [Phyllobacterium brassicacearum]|uniref:Uncharacterized protein n=1 Tax=Phyllobacterium brassicacearum TaxID=314235 RepID=A0A2P7BQA7_9HYPH|nr:hypothetical protein [Phyllobacterium brassicacearum]PSH68622.1 hypothetical protein CU102_12745 [Phyllobacterium brassicacearum]TDQ24172.1 hypothetical protein DEV91_11550 [Phyllobacterium brassicacearum]
MAKNEAGTAPFDLASLDTVVQAQEQGIEVDIKGVDGKTPLGFSIRVAGPDSERYRKAVDAITDEYLDREDAGPTTAAELDRRGLLILSKVVISWGSITLDGADLTCTEENARKLFSRFRFIREQVERKAGKRAAFTKG